MANKNVTVLGNSTFYNEVMDEAAVAAYVAAAEAAGYFTSPDGDIYIAFPTSSVVVHDEDYQQATRTDTKNF